MKSLIATFILFLSALTLAGLNRCYIHSTIEELNARLDAVPSIEDADCTVAAEDLFEYWKSKESILGLSVSYPFIDRICEQSELLCTCAKNGDIYGFAHAKALLEDAIEDLGRAERFSVGNLL